MIIRHPQIAIPLPSESKAAGTIEFYKTTAGERLALRRWHADQPVAQVVCLHGIISHGGWYDTSCQQWAAQGLDLHFLDRRGSGLNAAHRGDVPRMSVWLDDVIGYLEGLKSRGPLFLLGISWGGKLAPAIARARPDLLQGVGMLCPGIFARQQPGLLKRSFLRYGGARRFANRRIAIPLQEPELFTDTPPWRDYIRDDPLTLREITLRFAREDLRLTEHVRRSASFIHTPALLVLSGRDRIVDNSRTRRFFAQLGSPQKSLIEFTSGAHTLEFEPNPEPYIEAVADWVRGLV